MDNWTDLGGFEVKTVITSRFKLDGGTMFGQLPKPYWNRISKADELNRIPLVLRVLLVKTPSTMAMVEVGMGNDFSPNEAKRFDLEELTGGLAEGLKEAGVNPADIKHLVLTHLHFDHVAGLGVRNTAGELESCLPEAKVYLQRRHWEKANKPGPKEVDSFRPQDLELLAGMDLQLLDGSCEILPGFHVTSSDGHTTGLQVVSLHGQHERLYLPSDLIPTLAHVRLPFTMGYDMWPDKLIEEKSVLLEEICRHDGILMFIHDPVTIACRIKEGPRGYGVGSKITI